MPIVFRVIVGSVIFLFALLMAGEWVSHAFPIVNNAVLSQSGNYRFTYTAYGVVPLVNGVGRAPGEVRLLNESMTVVDSRHLNDVTTVGDVAWDRDHVFFTYRDGGKLYRGQLDFEP